MKLIVDAMGGDNAPEQIILGTALASEILNEEITLVGETSTIEKYIETYKLNRERFDIVHASEVITNDDDPATAVRRKKDSSVAVAMQLLKEDHSSVFVSAGSTGALLAGAFVGPGRIKGIKRPAIGIVLPNEKGTMTILLDGGANAECKAEYLEQFAMMGSVYMENMFHMAYPKVGLLNIGTEEKKGSPMVQQAHELLKIADVNFVGNIESRDFFSGNCDVIVADGFSGNLVLKTIEGTAETLFREIKDILLKGLPYKIAGALIKQPLKGVATKYDYRNYGGMPLLGVNAGIFKAHGSSDKEAFKNALLAANDFAQSKILEKIKEKMIEKNREIL
jgi:glycerol-3-phosphate acyltransferase PlsX